MEEEACQPPHNFSQLDFYLLVPLYSIFLFVYIYLDLPHLGCKQSLNSSKEHFLPYFIDGSPHFSNSDTVFVDSQLLVKEQVGVMARRASALHSVPVAPIPTLVGCIHNYLCQSPLNSLQQ